MIGVKLAASRRANDPLLDPVASLAGELGLPVLHHIWQNRRHEWPGQEASDAVELCELAARHPRVNFILAHIGGGGDWLHSLHAVRAVPNVYVDLSGSGVDGGMLELCLAQVGVERLLWGADITLCTGWAKLRYLEHLLPGRRPRAGPLAQRGADLSSQRVQGRRMIDVNAFLGGYPFRRVPGTSVAAILAAMDRTGITEAWVSHLPAIFWRDPTEGNEWLYDAARGQQRLRPVPCIEPGLANWEGELATAVEQRVPAVRVDPTVHGLDPAGHGDAAPRRGVR